MKEINRPTLSRDMGRCDIQLCRNHKLYFSSMLWREKDWAADAVDGWNADY